MVPYCQRYMRRTCIVAINGPRTSSRLGYETVTQNNMSNINGLVEMNYMTLTLAVILRFLRQSEIMAQVRKKTGRNNPWQSEHKNEKLDKLTK